MKFLLSPTLNISRLQRKGSLVVLPNARERVNYVSKPSLLKTNFLVLKYSLCSHSASVYLDMACLSVSEKYEKEQGADILLLCFTQCASFCVLSKLHDHYRKTGKHLNCRCKRPKEKRMPLF